MHKRLTRFWVGNIILLAALIASFAISLHGGRVIEAGLIAPLILFYVGLMTFYLLWWRRDRNAQRR